MMHSCKRLLYDAAQKAESMGREEKWSPAEKAPAVFHGSNASGWDQGGGRGMQRRGT